jgi:hypothetical protein
MKEQAVGEIQVVRPAASEPIPAGSRDRAMLAVFTEPRCRVDELVRLKVRKFDRV